jgi:hypothetical protein
MLCNDNVFMETVFIPWAVEAENILLQARDRIIFQLLDSDSNPSGRNNKRNLLPQMALSFQDLLSVLSGSSLPKATVAPFDEGSKIHFASFYREVYMYGCIIACANLYERCVFGCPLATLTWFDKGYLEGSNNEKYAVERLRS